MVKPSDSARELRSKKRQDPLRIRDSEAGGSGAGGSPKQRKAIRKVSVSRAKQAQYAGLERMSNLSRIPSGPTTAEERRRGKQPAGESVCPQTPERLVVSLDPQQERYHETPQMRRPHAKGGEFIVRAVKDYSTAVKEVEKERKKDPYMYIKDESLEYRFWNQFHFDFYSTVIYDNKNRKGSIVDMKWVDWEHLKQHKDATFESVERACVGRGLKDIMGFRYDWNKEILAQFHASYFFNRSEHAIYWTTEGKQYSIDYMSFSRLLGLGSTDEARDEIHNERKLKHQEYASLYTNPRLADGKTTNLKAFYYHLNNMFRETISPKIGDFTSLRSLAPNLLLHMGKSKRPFCIFSYMWHELKDHMDDPRKSLPYAPYIMYMIEKVTKITFPKTAVHEPFRPRIRHDLPSGPSRAPTPPPAPARRGHGSRIKAVLKAIFNTCSSNAVEIRRARKDMVQIKEKLNIESDPLPPFVPPQDPFVRWDQAQAAAAGDDDDEEEEEDVEDEATLYEIRRRSSRPSRHHEIEEEEEEEEEGDEDDDEEEGSGDDDGDDDYDEDA